MKRIQNSTLLRAGTLLLALAVMTSSLTMTRAKYFTAATNYFDGSGGFYVYHGFVEENSPTSSCQTIVLKKGWWAFCLRGGQGGKNLRGATDAVNDTGNGGSSGVAMAMFYVAKDNTTFYYYVAEGGGWAGTSGASPWFSGNNNAKTAVYQGGMRGHGSNDARNQPGGGGGATLLYYGDPDPTKATIVAVAGGGGGGGYQYGAGAPAHYIIHEFSGGWAGNAVATVGTANTIPAPVTPDISAWGGRSGGLDNLNTRMTTKGGGPQSDAPFGGESGYGGALSMAGSGSYGGYQNNVEGAGRGGYLRGGSGNYKNGAEGSAGGGGGYYGGGGGGQRGTSTNDSYFRGAGGGGSSFLNYDLPLADSADVASRCYQLPTIGAYRFAYEYFDDKDYFIHHAGTEDEHIVGSGENNAGDPTDQGGNTNTDKPERHDGALGLIYLGVQRTLNTGAVQY